MAFKRQNKPTIEKHVSAERQSFFSDLDIIIENILKYLPIRTLHKAALVCRKWSEVVCRIKRTRKHLAWLMCPDDKIDLVEQVENTLEVLSSQPETAILFCSTVMHEEKSVAVSATSRANSSKHPRAAKREMLSVTDYLGKVMPPDCHMLGISSSGIIGPTWEMDKLEELEDCSAMTCLLLPPLDGIDVYSFYLTGDKTEALDLNDPFGISMSNPETLRRLMGLPQDKVPKLTLLFAADPATHANYDIDIDYAILKQYGKSLVAGAWVDNILFGEQHVGESREPLMHGICFCGEDIKVASVILKSSVKTARACEQTLQRLKKANVPEDNSIGFVFPCIARGFNHYGKPNVEADAFHKLFPKTPLFGCFSNGETGYDFLPDYSTTEGYKDYSVVRHYHDDEHGDVWDVPELHHSYTTVFVLMSLSS